MKLKRFLLRYEPPGVGLEIETDPAKAVEVVHKDLPAQDKVSSSGAIRDLADQLIASEPDLLTKRRHSEALSQLLSRLYQIELEDEDDAQRASREATAAADHEPHAPSLLEGQQVVIVGLKGKLQVHNGETGTVSKARAEREKYEVLLAGPEPTALKVKGSEHLVPLVPKCTLLLGTYVAIRGLRNHIELNGTLGRIVEVHEEGHRFEVRAVASGDGGQLFRVKHDNVVAIDPAAIPAAQKENCEPNTASPRQRSGGSASASAAGDPAGASPPAGGADADEATFEPGSLVQLVGLKTAMHYNGQTAEVLSIDRVRGRYEIQMSDGSVKTIRAENVRPVGGAAKPSPRSRRQKEVAGGDGHAKQKA